MYEVSPVQHLRLRATFHIMPLAFILFTHVHLRDSVKAPLLKILLWNPEPPGKKGNGYELLAQRFLGSFEWTRVTSNWFIVGLKYHQLIITNTYPPKRSHSFIHSILKDFEVWNNRDVRKIGGGNSTFWQRKRNQFWLEISWVSRNRRIQESVYNSNWTGKYSCSIPITLSWGTKFGGE